MSLELRARIYLVNACPLPGWKVHCRALNERDHFVHNDLAAICVHIAPPRYGSFVVGEGVAVLTALCEEHVVIARRLGHERRVIERLHTL